MTVKWIGATLIFAGCGSIGFSMAFRYKKETALLHQLASVLEFMECELQYRLTPLPELCRQAGMEASGLLRSVFLNLSRELQWQNSPDAASCMAAAISLCHDLPPNLRRLLSRLGHILGRYELSGQLRGLQSVRSDCEAVCKRLSLGQESRIRSYRTLGLCAGAALAILFI